MSETTGNTSAEPENDDEDEVSPLDPSEFGPETIDGQRPEGTDEQTPSTQSEPGDPELTADPEDEPSG
ncbi:MAG: hypothetical protein JWR55_2563 [Aeromicrobium sp.]|jgi:hypothetical protein|nr:hypothetical protein [Aeromicrobium sp.]